MKKILTLDTWKLFTYLLLPFVFFIESPIESFLTSIWLFGLTFWFFILGYELNSIPTNNFKLAYWCFLTSIIIVFTYLSLTCILFFNDYQITKNAFDEKTEWKDMVMIPLHILTTLSLFYCIIFLSNRIVTIEQKGNIPTKEYIKTFFQFGVITLGIWWLHPRIKRILEKNNSELETQN